MLVYTKKLYNYIKPNSNFIRYISTSIRKLNCAELTCKGKYEILTVDSSLCDPCKPGPTVVIVGAGIAGLSAAQRLAYCGISKITVLEATERPGGRIHSRWLGDVVAEMGAQFIEGGCVSNPIYNLACEEGLLKHPVVRSDPSKGVFCTSEGRPIDSSTSKMAFHTFKQIRDEAAALFTLSSNRQGSLLNFFGIRIQQELKNFPAVHRFDADRVMYGLVNEVKTRWNEDLSLLSANRFGSYIAMPGGDLTIPIGFIGVVAPLLRDLPENAVRYSKPVETIKWGSVTDTGPRAIVKCSDGEEFKADYVIITVPLGVLKSHADKMFCPGLPKEKIEAINNIGYGNCNKIFLEYDKPFWVWSESNIKFAWSAEELTKSTDWVTGLASVDEVEGSMRILCARISGKEATMMEQCSDEEVAVKITQVLRQFTGDYCLPYPSSILRSKWGSNPHFRGGYSYMGLNTVVGHQFTLAEPIPGTCEPLPPGEATCPGHFSTVHGARLSGVREAERIVQLTKEYDGPPTDDHNIL